jgi:MFS family permease
VKLSEVLPDTGYGNRSVGSRVFQAVGGAMIMSIAAAMITAYIPEEQKGKAMSISILFAALGTALGPGIGGFLTGISPGTGSSSSMSR